MPDYPTMTATEAIRHAKDVSGMTAEEIAAAAGIRPAAVRRYLAMDSDDYFPGLDKIPALCRAMHNDVLLQWLQAQISSRKRVEQATSRAEVLTAAARAAASLGDVQRTTQNLIIARVDTERQLLLVRGAVPGAKGGEVIVRPAVKA